MPETGSDQLAVLAGRADRVLLVGSARSGTSWLIRALARAENTRSYYEPDNVDADPTGRRPPGQRGFGPYPVLRPGSTGEPFRPLWDAVFAGRLPRRRGWRLTVARGVTRLPEQVKGPLIHLTSRALTALPGGPQRTVVKSIYAVFSLDWLVDRYQPRVVVLQRNPRNVIASWRELDIPMFDLAQRSDIREFFVEPLGLPVLEQDSSPLAKISWHVGLVTSAIGDALSRHPEWLLISHEQLCLDPIEQIREVFGRLGIPWTADAEQFLADNNRPGTGFQVSRVAKEQPDRWRSRFTEAELAEVDAMLARFPRGGWVRPPTAGA